MNRFATKQGKNAFRRNRSDPAVSCGCISIGQSVVPFYRNNIKMAQKEIYTPQKTSRMASAPTGQGGLNNV